MSHEWDCRCVRCERDADWQAHDEPDPRADDEWERYEAQREAVRDAD